MPVYEAVATIREGYELCKIGIEYERSLKAIERYQEIVSKLDDERGVQVVLYLCPNDDTLRTITDVFLRSKKPVIAALMEDFVANPLGARAEVNLLNHDLQNRDPEDLQASSNNGAASEKWKPRKRETLAGSHSTFLTHS
jgi:hypothetical protein